LQPAGHPEQLPCAPHGNDLSANTNTPDRPGAVTYTALISACWRTPCQVRGQT